jgi:hypothetical protein
MQSTFYRDVFFAFMGPSKQRILKNIITIFDVPAHDEDSTEALHGGKRRVYVKKKWGGGGNNFHKGVI